MQQRRRSAFVRGVTAAVVLAFVSAAAGQSGGPGGPKWFRGNTHTHTWWSDGDSPPETVVKWYREHGYDFLVLSDHNILSEGEKWVDAGDKRAEAAKRYEEAFGPDGIVKRERAGKTEYRLATLAELRRRFEKPGVFLMIPGEEISDKWEKAPVHLGGVNLKELVPPQGGGSVLEVMQRNVDAVLAQEQKTGWPMLVHINHPNFGWGITAEELAQVRGEQFFEVYNGHPGVRNYGDETHASVERMWDIVLTQRLAELKMPVMYGLATDDAHSFTKMGTGSNPGRGWVRVRAKSLSPDEIVKAMKRGDFYATTGVVLNDVRYEKGVLRVEVEPRSGVAYKIQFIGTKKDYDRTVKPAGKGPLERLTRVYSSDLGKVLFEQAGPCGEYKLAGDELYVRAKVVSTAKHPNPYAEGDVEVAWVQPVRP
jgi:hypothetical protein